MNPSLNQGSWNDIRMKIKAQWAKLSADDIEVINGNFSDLPGSIERVYGYTRKQAERECFKFLRQLYGKESKRRAAIEFFPQW